MNRQKFFTGNFGLDSLFLLGDEAMTEGYQTPLIKLSHSSKFDVEKKRLYSGQNSGFFWNCTATLRDIIELHCKYNVLPKSIDFSRAFRKYRAASESCKDIDLYPFFFTTKINTSLELKGQLSTVKHHGVYRLVNFKLYSPLINRYFGLSEPVLNLQNMLVERYDIEPAKMIAVCYRGTDKYKECKLASPELYLSEAKRLLVRNPDHRVLIQTDDKEVRNLFVDSLGAKCFFFREMPVSGGTTPVHKLSEQAMQMNKMQFGQLLLAVTHLLSNSHYVINHTGNVALWLCLFRGSAERVLQFDKKGKLISGKLVALYRGSYYALKFRWRGMVSTLRSITDGEVHGVA